MTFIELSYPIFKTGHLKTFLLNVDTIERLTEYEYEGIKTTKISLTNRTEIEVSQSRDEIITRIGATVL